MCVFYDFDYVKQKKHNLVCISAHKLNMCDLSKHLDDILEYTTRGINRTRNTNL